MVVPGVIFQCFDALLLLSAAVLRRGLFQHWSLKWQRLSLSLDSQSDHIAIINAFRWLSDQEGCYRNDTIEMDVNAKVRRDFVDALAKVLRLDKEARLRRASKISYVKSEPKENWYSLNKRVESAGSSCAETARADTHTDGEMVSRWTKDYDLLHIATYQLFQKLWDNQI